MTPTGIYPCCQANSTAPDLIRGLKSLAWICEEKVPAQGRDSGKGEIT